MSRRAYPLVLLWVLVAVACQPDQPPPTSPVEEPAKPQPPGAPGAVRAEAEVGGALLAWSAPGANGGGAVTGYQVDSEPREASLRVTVEGTTARVSGLRAGATYRFGVSARNTAGEGPMSRSEAITLPDVPGAPQGLSVARGPQQVEVAWTPPGGDGGRPVLGYVVTGSPQGIRLLVEATARSARVGGLPQGEASTWTVRAFNAVGEGPDSLPSASVMPATVPSAPGSVGATAGVREATVTWSEPADTGGMSVEEYVVTAEPGGLVARVNGSARSATVTGLSNGTAYVLGVVARNGVGPGPQALAPSRRTLDVPRAPGGVKAVRDVRAVKVSWEAPTEDGGAPLTGYTVEVRPTGKRVDVGAGVREVTVTELPSTRAYTFIVSALNAAGTGPASPDSSRVRPLPTPVRVSSVEVPQNLNACTSIVYSLEQVDGERADVFIDVDDFGDGVFRRATQAGSTDYEGTLARSSSPGGTVHRFLWKAPRAVSNSVFLQVRVSARVPGTALASRTVSVSLPTTRARCDAAVDSSRVSVLPDAPLSAVTGDFDRDGKLDLVAVLEGSGRLARMRGLGNGAFEALPSVEVPAVPPSFRTPPVAADLDGDGLLELIWTDSDQDVLLVMRGQANGSFEPARSYYVGGFSVADWSRGLVVDDVDGDGFADVALVGSGGKLGIFWNQGDGTLGAFQALHDLGRQGSALTSADLDEDGRPDLVVAGESASAVLLSNADRTFRTQVLLGARGQHALLPGDYNGDGHVDLVTAESTYEDGAAVIHLSLLRGNGQGGFSAPVRVATVPGSTHIRAHAPVSAADLDGDGQLDLAVAGGIANVLTLLRGRGDGTFTVGAKLPPGQLPYFVFTADLDADGVSDVATLQRGNGSVRVWRGGPGRTEEPLRTMPGQVLASGDLNGDRWTDVVAALEQPARVVVSLGGPQGLTALAPIAVRDNVLGLQVARVDADAAPDVVVRYATSGTTVGLLLGNGDGTLRAAPEISVGATAVDADHGDVNGDGKLDLVFTTQRLENEMYEEQVRLLLGQGDGTFGAPRIVDTGNDPSQVLLGDVNGDGRQDLFVLRKWQGGGVQVFLGQGDGTFAAGSSLGLGSNFTSSRLGLADMDHDDIPDVVIGGFSSALKYVVYVLKGSGQGTFTPLRLHSTGGNCYRMALVDFDTDGQRDVVCTHAGEDSVSLMRGVSSHLDAIPPTRSFGTHVHGATALEVLNANGDGLLDVLVGGSSGSTALLLQY